MTRPHDRKRTLATITGWGALVAVALLIVAAAGPARGWVAPIPKSPDTLAGDGTPFEDPEAAPSTNPLSPPAKVGGGAPPAGGPTAKSSTVEKSFTLWITKQAVIIRQLSLIGLRLRNQI
jgi:hypothetical protein